ncbi:(Fe-S)-binding protein [Candidatus Thorarchaeota archaeon]|nr:MAG: (Fe-S)-binding protein [Candidatus Thorarchaeota archaeon]
MTLDEFEDMMDSCVRCSSCKFIPQLVIQSKRFSSACPSVDYYNFHAYSGGGRMIMANAYHKGRVEFTPEMLDVLYRCTNCGACEVSCKWVYDLEPNEAIHALRVAAVETGEGPMPNHKKYIEFVERNKNPYGEEPEKRPSWLPDNIEIDESSDTLYFVGCTAAYRREEIAIATAKVLNAANEGFRLLGSDEQCCGSPVYRVGDEKRAIQIMKDTIEQFGQAGIKRIITSCAGCYNMLKVEYPRFVEHDIEVIHTSQLIETLLKDGRLELKKKVPLKVTYHDPCHLGRMAEPYEKWDGEKIEVLTLVYIYDPPKPERRGANGVYDAPRSVLKQIPGVELVEMQRIREYSYCCGAGGGCKSAYPDFALATANERVEEAESTGASILVSACPFCGTNFLDSIESQNSSLEYLDLTELILRSIGGEE